MILSKKQITKSAQAGMRLCCLQTPEDRFSRVEAHIITSLIFDKKEEEKTKFVICCSQVGALRFNTFISSKWVF